jgi:hypothetical protein
MEWGSLGTGNGQFDTPSQIATNAAGDVFVADRGNHRIQKFTSTGVYITQWGSHGAGSGQFDSPSGIATDAAGDVYVADFLNNRIQKFTGAGVYVTEWGTAGSGNGQFLHPYSIAVGPSGDVYVVDYHNHRVQQFTGTGTFLNAWGGQGTGNGQFRFASGITTDAAGNVYVADILNARIQKFTANGTYTTQWGSYGSGPGQFGGSNILVGPYGLTTDNLGNVYVADGGNSRVEKFTSNGVYLGQWGTVGSGPGEFGADSPADIGRSPDGQGFYVSERVGNRVQLFRNPLTIASITDVRNDQGRNVWITWTRSDLDQVGSPTPITQYEVYRRVDPLPAPQLSATRPSAEPSQIALTGWAYVSSAPAHGDETYTLVAPTLVDSMADGIHRSVFLIRATTSSPYVTYSSPPDSGYSVDNLAPAPPVLLTAAYESGATHLDWRANSEPDLWYYNVYRGSSAGFVPGPGNRIASIGETDLADVGPAGGYYKLSAVDVNGNESGFVLVTPAQTTGVEIGAKSAFALEGVRPNPSRGELTTVSFVLASEAPASLEVLDVSGRRVFVRDLAGMGPGRHALDLAASRQWVPGLYLVRLTQASRSEIARMVVIE